MAFTSRRITIAAVLAAHADLARGYICDASSRYAKSHLMGVRRLLI